MWYLLVFTQYSYYCELFCLGTASRIREQRCHGWLCYIDTTKIRVWMFVWYHLVFTPNSYYCELFYLETELRLINIHCHMWVRFIDNTKITVACMSLLLLSNNLWQCLYFIMFYFKLNNGAIEKWCMFEWCNGEIKIRIGQSISHKYWICLFILFSKTTVSQQTKQFIIFNIWQLTKITVIKCMISNLATTKRQDFIRSQPIIVGYIVNLI